MAILFNLIRGLCVRTQWTRISASLFAFSAVSLSSVLNAQESLVKEAASALSKAATFFHEQVAVEGGYVYLVSSDLKFREGEGVADPMTVWVQPPGTPAVGMALLEAYQRTGDNVLLEAAKDAGDCLVRGQLHSGGWQDHIDFSPELRNKLAYRVEGERRKKARNLSTFDDDKTQSAVRFLCQLDKTLEFRNQRIHEATPFALDSILKNQFANGGWAQVYELPPEPDKYPILKAKYPADTWPREYPGGDYWFFYTINDNNISKLIETLFLAAEVYSDERYRKSALKGADFLLLSQMPEPQPAWAQQYDFEMQPVWARKFEPPAVSGGESQNVIRTLMDVYIETGDRKYLEPIPRAISYLEKCQLPGGKIPRFLELETNRPLYFTREYNLTYSSDDMPTHYGFITNSSIPKLQKDFRELENLTETALQSQRQLRRASKPKEKPNEDTIRHVISALDSRGAWIEPGQLRYHKGQSQVTQIITSETFIRNIQTLSMYVGSRPFK